MSTSLKHLRIYVLHRIKLSLLFLIRFVIARPKLLGLGMRVVNRIPALKWQLWRIHASMRAGAPSHAAFTDTPPAAARPAFLQLIEPGEDY